VGFAVIARITAVVLLIVLGAFYIQWITERDENMMRVMDCGGTESAARFHECVQELGIGK
jgi:uncharacterized protein YacL